MCYCMLPMEFSQALWRLGLLFAMAYGNGWSRDFDFVDSAPVTFGLILQDHHHIVVQWTADNTLQNVTYEIQVSRTENFNLIETVNISSKPQESHNWTWTSKLPLDCTDHSLRMRAVYNSTFVGSWSPWKTNFGVHEHNDLQIFPSMNILQEKSEVYFCCVAPRKTQVARITFNRKEYPLINISSQVKAIAVGNLNITSELGVRCDCFNSLGGKKYTYNFVTFPPQKPRNLSCETEDLRRWSCKWDPGRQPNLIGHVEKRHYTLHVRNSHHGPLRCETSSCSFQAFTNLHEYVVTVEVANRLGRETESIRFNALSRVFPVAKDLSVISGATDANISWTIEGNFTNISMICQVKMNHERNVLEIEQMGGLVLLFACQLENLKPSTQYSLKVHCAVSGQRWGKWTNPLNFTTNPLVNLDIWRHIQALSSSRHLIVTWRTYTTGSLSDVKSYEVQLQQRSKVGTLWTNTTRINPQVRQSNFIINERGYNISVHAEVAVGTSIPAHILIPPADDIEKAVMPKRLAGSGTAGFILSWTEDVSAVCDYTIEWCQNGTDVLPCSPSNTRWKTACRSDTSLSLKAGEFVRGRRYTFNIYVCREDGHHLIETHVGFLEEQRPTHYVEILNSPVVTSSSVIIEWIFPEDHPHHPGFITGYVVTLQDGHMSDQNPNSYFSVDNPHSKSLTIPGLQESRKYNFCIQPRTSAGLGPSACRTFTTSPDQTLFWVKILIPVVFVFGCVVLFWTHWKRLRSTFVEIFAHPTKVNVKIVELDSHLYETSKRIEALRVEDCMCSDLEVMETRQITAEPKFLVSPNKADCPFVPLMEHCNTEQLGDDVFHDPVCEMGMNICNITYSPTVTEASFCLSSSSSDGPTTGQLVQPHSTCTTDYVTCSGIPT